MNEEDEKPEGEGAEASLADMITQLEAEIGEWKDHAMRAVAEAENVRRRAEREMNDARAYAIQRFAKDLLTVADSLARAVGSAPRESEDGAVRNFILGVEMTEKALRTAFETHGLKRIEPEAGARFDPHQHQAMMEQPAADAAAGSILSLLQPGYELFGRVVRPAMVVVAARSQGQQGQAAEAMQAYAKAAGAGSADDA